MMPVELYRAVRATWTDEELKKMRSDYRPGMLKEWVKRFCRLFLGSIFKWVQAPQAVHLGALDLDRERALQIPVVQSPEWLEIDAIDSIAD
jgi:NAD+ synthase (glutamine-hydrolysing)